MARTKNTRIKVVLDTSVFVAKASPWDIEDLKALGPVDFVVPAAVVSELDTLMTRADMRDRARSAIHVLKALVQRGAATKAVTCGGGSTVRVARVNDEEESPGLDLKIADDRILATCLSLPRGLSGVATTEFAMYAKSLGLGLAGYYLESYADPTVSLSRREKDSFRQFWGRVANADTPWKICRRGLSFLQSPVVTRFLKRVEDSGEPAYLADVVRRFRDLSARWTVTTDLHTLIEPIFGLKPPIPVDYSVRQIVEQQSFFRARYEGPDKPVGFVLK